MAGRLTISVAITMETKLVPANTSRSLRTTVPSEVIKALGLKEGCQVVWEIVPSGKKFGVRVSFRK